MDEHNCLEHEDFTPLPNGYGCQYCAVCGETTGVGGWYDQDPEALARYYEVMERVKGN